MKSNLGAQAYRLASFLGTVLFLTTLQHLSCGDAVANEFAKVFEGAEANTVYVHLKAGGYKLTEPGQNYVHYRKGDVMVRMTGYTVDDSPGNPALPYKTFHVALPPDADVTTLAVEVVHVVEKELPARVMIAPAPPYLLDQMLTPEQEEEWEFHKWGMGKKIVKGRNVLVYNNDAFFPQAHALVESSGQLRKWKATAIKFYPIRYNPVQKRAVLATETIIKIHFSRLQQLPPQMKALLRDTTMDERAKQLFLNYDRAQQWYKQPLLKPAPQTPPPRTDKESRTVADPDFVIVTTDHTRSTSTALADFCFHKQDLGYSLMIVTEHNTYTVSGAPGAYAFSEAAGGYEDVTGDEAPNQTPQKIRKWLIDNYLALGIHYVLLMGDPDPDNIADGDHIGDIPMLMSWPYLLGDTPTDTYYADLTGTWNSDGDTYIGEGYAFAGSTTLPAGVTGNLFSVRWEGVVEVSGATDTALARFTGYTGGRTRIWLDEANDGFTDEDLILDDGSEHHPNYRSTSEHLGNGTYPIRIELRQSAGDAYFTVNLNSRTAGAMVTFKYDTGGDVLSDGLLTQYYNTDDFSGALAVEQVETRPDVEYIAGGDRGVGGVDLYPEVIVGRIPFYDEDSDGEPDVAILDGILNKIIAYENANVHEQDWRRRVLSSTPYMYNGNVADYRGCETLRSDIAPPPLWEWFRIHDEDYGVGAEITDGCTVDKTVQAWNDPADPDDGRGVVMWRTHGSQTGANHVFSDTRCSDLDDSKPSFVIETTCQNGHPEVEAGPSYPLAYSLLKHGAIATIAATRNSWGGTFDPALADVSRKNNPYLMYFFAKGIFNNIKVGDVVAHVREDDATFDWVRNVVSYNLYGDPTVSLFGPGPKSNNDTILLLDGSGSMLSEGKWEAATDAAVLFRDVTAALRHPAFEDRYNTVVFRCMGGSNESSTVPAGTGLKDIADPLTMVSLDAFEPEGAYFTPIGGGLEMAYAQFDPDDEKGFYANRTVVLLSDGKHNCGVDPTTIAVPQDVIVHAVGLGEDSIEPETIRDIAGATGGDYRISPSPREIEDFFVQILASTSWKLQNIPVTDDQVQIDQNKAVFSVVWDDPAANVSFELNPPGDAPNVTPAGVPPDYAGMTCDYDAAAGNETHAFYSCDNIPDDLLGEWRFANINDGVSPVALGDVLLKVIEDPRVLAKYSFDEGDAFTGQPITLIARITEDGTPLTGLTDVYADLIRSPALAMGTLMAKYGSSQAPREAGVQADRTPRAQYLLQSMEAANISTLVRNGGSRIELRDDGTGIDKIAKDGVYTGVYQNTVYEGSYTFAFRFIGMNREGVAFNRAETLSEFVKFNASATTTDVSIPSKVVDNEEKIVRATVRVTPKDAFGAYLGPFRGDIIRLWSSVGTIASKYTDHYDGSYSFELVYPIDVSPLISVAVGNVLVAERTPIKVDITHYWFWLLIAILVLILLAVIILIIRRFL